MDRSVIIGTATTTAVFVLGYSSSRNPSPASRDTRSEIVSVAAAPAAAPLHLTGTDLLSAFYGRPITKTDASSLKVIIAMLPDPVSSHLDWSYDAEIASVRRALEHSGYVIDRFWLPWRTSGDSAIGRLGVADSFPAVHWPGVMLFRRRNPVDSSLVLVYTVGEVPTSGVHTRALHAALNERRTLLGRDSSSKGIDTIRVVGPAFSGSSISLRRSISLWRDSTGERKSYVEIVTGSASDSTNLQIFNAPWLRFSATVHTSSWLATAAESLIVRRLGIPAREIAFLHEGTTQFGQAASDTSPGRRTDPLASPLTLAFPLSISSLRVQYARHPEPTPPSSGRDAPSGSSPPPPRLAMDQREPASLTESPAILSQLTAPAAELLLTQIEQSLLAHHIRAVGILATDIRDELFLAGEIRKRLRDVEIFFYGSNVLLLRPEYRHAIEGSLVLSTYPIFLENQYWDLTKGDHERLVFMSDEAEGVFNATLYQLGNQPAMTEYATPMADSAQGETASPPTWLTVIGHDGIYPVTILSDTSYLPAAAERRYVQTRTAPSVRPFTELTRPAWRFLVVLFVLLLGFVTSFVILQRRTAPRVNAIIASPRDFFISDPKSGSAQEPVTIDRVARWASLLLHRELYVLLRYFCLFTAFSSGLLLLFRPRAHGIESAPQWSLWLLGLIATFLTIVVFKRAIVQSRQVLEVRREQPREVDAALASRRRRDRLLGDVEIGARFLVLITGLAYFLVTLVLLNQVQHLSQRESAFFFQRAISISGGVSPAVPLILSAVAFVTWCSWHLMRISLLAEPTVYEDFLLRRSLAASRLKEAKRSIRECQSDAERSARLAIHLSYRAALEFRKELKVPAGATSTSNGKRVSPREFSASSNLLVQARAAARSASEQASSAEQCIATARGESGTDLWTDNRSRFLETRDVRHAADQASRAVQRAELFFHDRARPTVGSPTSVQNAPAASSPSRATRPANLLRAAPMRFANAGARRIGRGYAAFENWYDRSRRMDESSTRSSNAAVNLNDALFFLVPNGSAFTALVVVTGLGIWLGSQFELSLESLMFPAKRWLGGVTAFDALFRFAVLALAGLTAWGIYRLGSVWMNARTILRDVNPDLIPAFVALPEKLARVTRLTAFGHTSRSDIEDVVEERWKAMRSAFARLPKSSAEEVKETVGAHAFDRPPLPRSRPYELNWNAYHDFAKLDAALELCRRSGWLASAHSGPHAAADVTESASPQRKWANTAAELYVVYLADYIDWVFQHLRYLASFLLISLVLTMVLLASYPFQPQSLIMVIYTIILVVGVSTLLVVVLQMNRDNVLSAIANTTGGKLSWDSQLVGALVTYGAIPLLTLISTQFPEVREFLFSWVTPLLRALSKG